MKTKNGNTKVLSFPTAKESLYNAEIEKEQNIVGERIDEARRKAKLTLPEFSALLADYGVKVSASGINKWVKGNSAPNAYQLLAICYALHIEDSLPYFTGSYMPLLNDIGQQKVSEYRADLIASGNYKPESRAVDFIKYREMPVSNLSVSAGTGAFLDEGTFEMIQFPENSVPAGAEFGVRVSGNSMEPVYHDGQIVWVQQCESLAIGQVGVFIYDGEGYLKVYSEQEPDVSVRDDFTDSYGEVRMQPVMLSYNQDYAPRSIVPGAAFRVVGRVL